jgi:uncharacterized protein Veg
LAVNAALSQEINMAKKLFTHPKLSSSPKRGNRVGAHLKSALAVTAFAVLAAAGFSVCKLAGSGGGDDFYEEHGISSDGIVSFSKTGDIKFKDDTTPFDLKANLYKDILSVASISWAVDKGNDVIDISGSGETITVTPKGKIGDALITATLTPNTGIKLGDLKLDASFALTVIEIPTITVNQIGDIMLNSGGQPRERHISATYLPNKLSEYNPVFEWEFVSGGDKAELDARLGNDVTLKAKNEGSGKLKAKLKLLEREFPAELAFNIKKFDANQEKHKSITIVNAPSSIIATDTSAEFSVNFTPPTALYETIDWVYDKSKFSLNSSVKDKIKLTAKAGSAGVYTIKAKSAVDSSVEASFNITVNPVTVTVKAAAGKGDTISKGEDTKYEAVVNAQNKTVIWSVSSANVRVNDGVISNHQAVSAITNVNVTAKSSADTSASGAKSLTLKPPVYTLVYDKNAASATGTMKSENKTFGTPYTLSANAYSNSAFSFSSWNTSNTGKNGVSYANNQANVNIEPSKNGATVTLYAQWASIAPTTITGNGTWTAPATGTYRIEVWGAQGVGGDRSKYDNGGGKDPNATGGLGGYSKGEKIALNAGDVLIIKVGVQGGGGAGVAAATKVAKDGTTAWSGASGAGGGKTEVLKGTTTLIVAGGGGGAGGSGNYKSGGSSKHSFYPGGIGGSGGGYNAAATDGNSSTFQNMGNSGKAATASAHGAGGPPNGFFGVDAGPGNGGNSVSKSGQDSFTRQHNARVSGGGGGGGAGYKNGGGGGYHHVKGGTEYGYGGYGGGGGSGYALVGSGGFKSASGKAGVQSGDGKVLITYVP